MKRFTEEELKKHRKISATRYYQNNKEHCKKKMHEYCTTQKYRNSKRKTNITKFYCYVNDERWDEIEGYDRVLADGCDMYTRNRRWMVHHRLEDYGFSSEFLKEKGLYFHREPSELIWMSMTEHYEHHQNLIKEALKLMAKRNKKFLPRV